MKKALLLAFCFMISITTYCQQFERNYGTNYELASQIIHAIDGGFILVSSTSIPNAPSGFKSDILIVKIDSNGLMQWSETLKSTMDDEGVSINLYQDSTYLISANSYDNVNNKLYVSVIQIDVAGSIIDQQSFSSYNTERVWCTKNTTDGGIIIAGETLSSDLQMYLLKLDSLQNVQWSMAYGDGDQEYGTCVIEAKDHGFVETGVARINSFMSSICVVKTSLEGGMQWAKKYNTSPIQTKCLASGIIATSDGGYLISGTTFDVLLKSAMLLMKIDSIGNIEWQKIYPGTDNEYSFDLIKDDDGYIFCGPATDQYSIDKAIICNVDTTGNLKWQMGFAVADSNMTPYTIQKTTNDHYLITGLTDATLFGTSHVLLIETDSIGDGLCHYFTPALNTLNSHLVADPFFGSVIDTTHVIIFPYVVGSGVQQQSMCDGTSVTIPEELQAQKTYLFQDRSGNIFLKSDASGNYQLQVFNIQGQLISRTAINITTGTEKIFSHEEAQSIFTSAGKYIFSFSSDKNINFTASMLVQ